jgi:hypothetical protein
VGFPGISRRQTNHQKNTGYCSSPNTIERIGRQQSEHHTSCADGDRQRGMCSEFVPVGPRVQVTSLPRIAAETKDIRMTALPFKPIF